MYQDMDCIERAQDLMLLDGGCYANLYSDQTKAYSLKIVGFGAVPRFHLYEYIGICHPEYQYSTRPRTIEAEKCERFLGSGEAGIYYARIYTRYRANTCVGSGCSTLNVVVQNFYKDANCLGLALQTYKYPLKDACLRWSNGTQTFRVDAALSNITQVDYLGDDGCGGDLVRTYTMTNRRCYSLYDSKAPRSFAWSVEESTSATGSTISAVSRVNPAAAAMLAPGLAALAAVAPSSSSSTA